MSRTTGLSHGVRARPRRLRLGVAMIALAVVGSVVAFPLGAARAQDEGDQQPQTLPITKQAYWTRSLGYAAPPALTNHFPPTVVCLVFPQACNNPLSGQLAQIDAFVLENQPEAVIPAGGEADILAQALVGGEDNLPSGVVAGARRYLSAIQFDFPAVPAGERVSNFDLVLTPVEDLTFHVDSPGFRQAVLSVLAAYQSESPEVFLAEFQKVGDDAHPLVNQMPLGVEACPIVADHKWEAGSNQDAATAPERDTVERTGDGVLQKQVDCNLGGNGKIVGGKWVFDLTLAANAWAEGKMVNNGVLLRPVVPPFLAYGDPDLSSFDQVVFFSPASTAVPEELPAFVMATKEKAKPVSISSSRTLEPQVLGEMETFNEVFGSIDDVTLPPGATTPAPRPPEAQVALPALSGSPVTAWWTWLLLPMLLGGIFLTTQALTAEAAPVLERSGAMTRLIEARRRGELT